MKNIYFVQASQMLSNSIFLPYAVGAIAAYTFQFEDIQKQYRLGKFIFQQLPVQEVICDMEEPYLVAFSSYMWNVEFNYHLAQAIKEKWPNCIVVFGGPQVSDDMDILKEKSFVDILTHGEGEQTFCALLRALSAGEELSAVHNISYRDGGTLRQTPKTTTSSLENYPSPYTLGYFDSIINDPKLSGTQFDTVIETNRGCPYSCIYCYWGGGQKKVLQFPMEKVKQELLWMAEHKICFCYCADSNFGILSRDEEIVDYVVQLRKEYGYPEKFETIATKNKNDRVLRINQKLHSVNLNKAVSIAVQTMTPKVLEVIGRKNADTDNLEHLYQTYRQNDIFTYTDVILGFPEETLESFCHSLFRIIEAGQHSLINVFRCELLPNTKYRTREIIEKYNIRTIRSHLRLNHGKVRSENDFGSCSEIVVSTNTMSTEEWEQALRVSVCVQCFHCLGLLRHIAVYLRKAREVSYEQFYLTFFRWVETQSQTIKQCFDYVCATVQPFLEEKSDLYFADPRFGDIYWPFEEGLFLCCAQDLDSVFAEVKTFLSQYFEMDDALEDLLRYQKESIALPNKTEKKCSFAYDWKQYFENLYDKSFRFPEKRKMLVHYLASKKQSWAEYARQTVWYGRYSEKTMDKDIHVSYA